MYDRDRIKKLLKNSDRKLQFMIAGKAHPKDTPGKELIRDIVRFSREEDVRHSVVFIEDYDTYVSGLMLAGCDIWLNTPLRPREASGTSGMKAAMNGCLNLSVLDGWWAEADYFNTGWPIGLGEEYDDLEYQNRVESNAIYEILDKDALPLFYHRVEESIPSDWIAKMKDAIRLNTPLFNTARMVRDYAVEAYIPASDRMGKLRANDYVKAKDLAHWKQNLTKEWHNISIKSVEVSTDASDVSDIKVSQPISVKAEIYLAGLKPDDVEVELYQGIVEESGEVEEGKSYPMALHGDRNGVSVYTAQTSYAGSGLHGLSLRILPKHPSLSNSYEPRLIHWA
jgi:starch phosphorylase